MRRGAGTPTAVPKQACLTPASPPLKSVLPDTHIPEAISLEILLWLSISYGLNGCFIARNCRPTSSHQNPYKLYLLFLATLIFKLQNLQTTSTPQNMPYSHVSRLRLGRESALCLFLLVQVSLYITPPRGGLAGQPQPQRILHAPSAVLRECSTDLQGFSLHSALQAIISLSVPHENVSSVGTISQREEQWVDQAHELK